MYLTKWKNYYFEQKEINIPKKWILLRRVGKDSLSSLAQERLEWIIFYHTVGKKKAKTTATYFGITRKTLHKYLKRFNERDLISLDDHSRSPHRVRRWEVTRDEESNITKLRNNNMEFGKKKLKVLYQKEYGVTISTWKIERVIRKYKLYPDKIKHDKRVEKKKRNKARIRIHTVPTNRLII